MNPVRKKRKKIIIFTVVLALLGGVAFGVTSCMKTVSGSMETLSSTAPEIVKAEIRDIHNSINVSGMVESQNTVKVTSKLNAKIKTLNVGVGTYVKAGDVLCTFDNTELQQQYDSLLKSQQNAQGQSENQHKINLRNLESAKQDKLISLEQAQRSIDEAVQAQNDIYQKENQLVNELNEQIAQRDEMKALLENSSDEEMAEETMQAYQEAAALVESKQAELDAIREQFSTYDNAVQSAVDAYSAAERSADTAIQSYQDVLDAEQFQQDNDQQAELNQLADSLAQCTVTAPKSGMITALNISEGSIPTEEELMTIEDVNALKVTVQIGEANILNVHEGQRAIVKTNATGDEELEAKVSRVVNIYHANNSQENPNFSGTGGYSAEILLKQNDNLLIGMNAKVQIILEEKQNVLSVPYESILPMNEKKQVLKIIRNDDGTTATLKAVDVETGMEGTYYTEITSEELKEGDEILMTPDSHHDGEQIILSGAISNALGGELHE